MSSRLREYVHEGRTCSPYVLDGRLPIAPWVKRGRVHSGLASARTGRRVEGRQGGGSREVSYVILQIRWGNHMVSNVGT
jgi:hypothetical protein